MSGEMKAKRKRGQDKALLSRKELARFLSGLAQIHSAKAFGNSALAESLRVLAGCVTEGREYSEVGGERVSARTMNMAARGKDLHSLSAQDVVQILDDRDISKSELLRLAAERFSFPVSQLSKMRVDDLRQSIRNALLHEVSIEIISEEAEREGGKRRS